RDDDVRKRFARYIHAAPKTVRPEEHTARRRFELLKQFATRRSPTLDENVHILPRKEFLHRTRDLLHVAIAREQDKRATFTLLHEICDPMFEGLVITTVAGIGHFLNDEHLHLVLKIEGTADLKRFGIHCADTRAKICEVRATHRQSGAGHHATAVVAKE